MYIHRCRFVDHSPHTITSSVFSHASSSSQVPPAELRLAVGRSNGDIEIWNPRNNWNHELTLPGARGCSIDGLCWSSTSEYPSLRLFSIGGSTYITEWDLTTGYPLKNYDCNAGIIWSIDVNSEGTSLAVGCDDGSVVVIDISGGPGSLEHKFICQRQDLKVLCIKWFNDDRLIGGCADARIRCWSAAGEARGRILGVMRVDKSKTESTLVWSIAILPNRSQIVSGDSTGGVKFWDAKYFTLLQSFKVHDADVLCLALDSNQEKLFSAGVDRKIHEFSHFRNNGKPSRWIHDSSRLLHSNDVRTLSIYESKICNFLVSGGVESSIVIQSVAQFQEGKYRKLDLSQCNPNIVVNAKKQMIVKWQDQTIKIWQTFLTDDLQNKHKLVAKLLLKDEENINGVSINEDGTLLAVSRLSSVKFFRLAPKEKSMALKVSRIQDESFLNLIEGAKRTVFYSQNEILILTTSEELYRFEIDADQNRISLKGELTFPSITDKLQPKLPYKNCIKNLVISSDSRKIAISRFNRSIEILPVHKDDFEPFILIRLSILPHLISFSDNNDSLVVLADDNKIYEFNCENRGHEGGGSLLTLWSKRNSEFIPKQFLNLEEKPQGIFAEPNSKRIWVYSSSWLSYFDLSSNIPINTKYRNSHNSALRKRSKDGLTINRFNDESRLSDNEDNIDTIEENDVLEESLKQGQSEKLRQKIEHEEESLDSSGDSKPFWLTMKYRQLMLADIFGDGIIIIEKPPFTSTGASFELPKLKV